MCPRSGTTWTVGLWPYTPQKCAGTRIDPPMSLPTGRYVSPAASAAASPPLEPPAVRATFHGLFVRPNTALSLCQYARPFRRVRLPEDHRAGRAIALDDRRIARRNMGGELGRAGGRLHSRGLERVLDRARHAVERAPPLAARARLVGGSRASQRGGRGQRDNRVEGRVVALDAVEDPCGQLDRGDVTTPDRSRRVDRRDEVEVSDGAARRPRARGPGSGREQCRAVEERPAIQSRLTPSIGRR